MPVEEFVKVERVGRAARITIDHPPMNTVSSGILQELAKVVTKYEGDNAVRAILLDSANQKPPYAADGAALLANSSWEAEFEMVREGQRALSAIEFSSKPIVMAIYDGICMGGGLELALSCHIRVAGKGTIFAVPEAPAGAMPGWGNTQRLVQYFGRGKALELALTGCQINAAEAHALGAVNHVVGGPEVLFKARQIAEGIARIRTKSVTGIMTAMHVPYPHAIAEGKVADLVRYMEIYDPKLSPPQSRRSSSSAPSSSLTETAIVVSA